MMSRTFLLVLLSAQPQFAQSIAETIRVEGHVAATMRDGVKLYGDVYRPRREGRFPTLITRTPYGVQREGMHQSVIQFAQQGYAVVVQDARGRYESEGAWDPFRNEANDGFDTVEWAASQPWSNGKVGMHGGSYLGHVQWQAASKAPPHLTTIFPVLASTSIYHNTFYHGGAFKLALAFGWGVVRMPNRIMNPQSWHMDAYAPQELKYENIIWTLPLNRIDVESSGQKVGFFRNWLKHQSYDDYWRHISDEERFGQVKVPAYTFGGWFDLLLGGTINGYTGLRAKGATEIARKGTKMIIGPWGHGASQKYGDIDFGPQAMRSLFDLEMRWNDHYLKGVDNGIDREPPVDLFFMGINKWEKFNDWPVPGSKFTPLYLASGGHANSMRGDGRLQFGAPSGAATDQYVYDPHNPVPSLGGNDCCGAPFLTGPRDQRPVESRHDVLVYTTDILSKPVAIAGPVKMNLHAATDGRDTDFMIKLVDVYPDGRTMNIAEGILRARFYKGLDKIELLEPNRPYTFEIDMRGTANVFQVGHRIRVDVTSSNFPQYDRNPNTGEDLGVSDRVRTANQTVFHSGDRRSHILLPVVAMP
ncbi:MAG TPA: CocE/NonD family hydrolase [Bryobacteraceae bacterium]|nr:CocE/NonD family hydrolase [Bryobacteraceae bacterium]